MYTYYYLSYKNHFIVSLTKTPHNIINNMPESIINNRQSFVGEGAFSSSSTFNKSLALRVDGGINAVTIAPSGRDVVMASKNGIYVLDLDDPYKPPRFLEHQTPWQVADVQYSPHPQTSTWVISTSNQKALIWNLMRNATNAIEHTLHAHYRAITDINWHPHDHNLLSTASVDTRVLAWDLRDSRNPVYKTSDWKESASQVKWNLKNKNVLASSHGNHVSLWDIRKGTSPFIQLKGHSRGINNISFNPNNEYELMSSSMDGTIKIWNYESQELVTNDNQFEKQTVVTEFPVWRGRYLPFGEGLCALPMVGGNNSAYMASLNNEENTTKLAPVYLFKGHTDRITDFLWRSRHTDSVIDDREFQLVTWSNDSDLRLWPIAENVYQKVNFSRKEVLDAPLIDHAYKTYSKDVKFSGKHLKNRDVLYKFPKEKFTTKSGRLVKDDIDHLSWLSGVRVDSENANNDNDAFDDLVDQDGFSSLYKNLGEEVAVVGKKLDMVSFEKISVSTGDIVVSLNGPWNSLNENKLVFVRAVFHFEPNYPKHGAPTVTIEESREITNDDRLNMIKEARRIGSLYADCKQNSLEAILRYLLGEKVNINPEDILQITPDIAEYDIMKNLGFDEEDIWNTNIKNEGENETISVSSSESDESDDIDDITKEHNFIRNNVSNKSFDSTPVPKGCGAVFSHTGQLVCFFTSTTADRQKKVQDKIINASAGAMRGFGRFNKQDQEKSEVDSISSKGNESSNENKPKTYLESLALKNRESEKKTNGINMDEDKNSNEDEWEKLLKNDITFRTKMPVFANQSMPTANAAENTQSEKNTVTISNYSFLIPDKKQLAVKYKTQGASLPLVCKHNADVAREIGENDVADCWEIIGDMLKSRSKDTSRQQDWSYDYDGGQKLISEMFSYFEKSHNLQMLAMMACILVSPGRKHSKNGSDSEKYPEFVSGDISFDDFYAKADNESNSMHKLSLSRESLNRQNSVYSQSTRSVNSNISNNLPIEAIPGLKIEVSRADLLDNGNIYYPDTQEFIFDRLNLLHPEEESKFIKYREQYAEMLYTWGLQSERSNILRFNINENSDHKFISSMDEQDLFRGLEIVPADKSSDRFIFCRVCDEPVVKRSSVCNKCGCITHSECAKIWWDCEMVFCPSGCGCECLLTFQKVN